MTIAATAKIYAWARLIHNGTNLSVGDHSQIDDFAFVHAGKMCKIGRFVHIASFVSITGGGQFSIDDFSGFSAGCRVITGTDEVAPFLTGPIAHRELIEDVTSYVTIGKHVIVGTNAVIFPGLTIGDGAAIGACATVRKDLAPWGIYAGEPLRRIGERDRDAILEKKRLFLQTLGEDAPF